MRAIKTIPGIRLRVWAAAMSCRSTRTSGAQTPRGRMGPEPVAIVIGPAATALQHDTAGELCRYLDALFGIETRPVTEVPASSEVIFLIGNAQSNPVVAAAMGENGWPKTTDPGIVLRRASFRHRPALVVGGGSPVATM